MAGISNFDRNKYLGSWYEYANVFEFYQIGSSCVRATYTDEGARIGVFNEQVNTMYVTHILDFLISLIFIEEREVTEMLRVMQGPPIMKEEENSSLALREFLVRLSMNIVIAESQYFLASW